MAPALESPEGVSTEGKVEEEGCLVVVPLQPGPTGWEVDRRIPFQERVTDGSPLPTVKVGKTSGTSFCLHPHRPLHLERRTDCLLDVDGPSGWRSHRGGLCGSVDSSILTVLEVTFDHSPGAHKHFP